jgi:hypothetical protein
VSSKTLHFPSPRHLHSLYGGHEENLLHAERMLGVKLVTREDWLKIEPPAGTTPASAAKPIATTSPAFGESFTQTGLPVAERMRFAEQARAESRRYTRSADSVLMDVNADEVDRTLAAHRVRRIVHGHTHRPNVHRWVRDDAELERIVLGDWYDQGSSLAWEHGRRSLASF